MSSFNVLRWSSLAAGILYGAYHTEVLRSEGKAKDLKAEFDKQSSLIQKAKAEFAKQNVSKEPKTQSSSSFNLEDPNLDFSQAIQSAVEGLK